MGSFGDNGHGDLVFYYYYGVVYGCIWGAKVLRWDLGSGRGLDAEWRSPGSDFLLPLVLLDPEA